MDAAIVADERRRAARRHTVGRAALYCAAIAAA